MKQFWTPGLILFATLFHFCHSYNNFNELRQDMEARVERIATALQTIYAKKCQTDFFECPVKSFNICEGTDERTCLNSFPTTSECNGVTRYSMTSGIRFPNSVASFNLSDQMKFFFCKTAEPQFENVFQELIYENDRRYAWSGVSSSNGGIRVSPGFKYAKQSFTESCRNFDPRLRPWYSSNVYNRKKMVIIVQNSRGIHERPNRYPSIQKSLKAVLKTAQPSDLINVIQFSNEARALLGGQDLKLVTLSEEIKKYNASPDAPQDFYDWIASNITRSNSIEANYTKAIEMAVQILQNSKNTNNEMENFILMFTGFRPTNYTSSTEKEIIELMSLKEKQLEMNFLFFGFGVNLVDEEGKSLMSSLACNFDGLFIELPDLTYESLFIDLAQGYYEYQSQGNQVKGYRWTDFYEDAFGMGKMVSVIRPAYYKENGVSRLIGVAVMDILISQLRVYKTEEDIRHELATTQIPFRKNISLCALETIRRKHRCFGQSLTGCPAYKFCTPKINPNETVIRSPVDSTDSQCCPFAEHSKVGLIVGLSVGLSSAIVLIVLLVYCLIFRKRGRNELEKTYAEIFQKFKDFDQTRIRSNSEVSLIKD